MIVLVACPKCRKVLEIDSRLRFYIESVRQLGCDDCLRRMAMRETGHLTASSEEDAPASVTSPKPVS